MRYSKITLRDSNSATREQPDADWKNPSSWYSLDELEKNGTRTLQVKMKQEEVNKALAIFCPKSIRKYAH
jgi:hypothetical protein